MFNFLKKLLLNYNARVLFEMIEPTLQRDNSTKFGGTQ